MLLHVFNPEHEIALAYNNPFFTPPRAGRQMRQSLEWLPILWANEGDLILVKEPKHDYKNILEKIPNLPDCHFITYKQLNLYRNHILGIDVWGWDSAIRHELAKYKIPHQLLPSDEQLLHIRALSHRRYAAQTLKELRNENSTSVCDSPSYLVGEAWEVDSLSDLASFIQDSHQVVIKAPWSSSGRGVRIVSHGMDINLERWARGVIRQQGSLMVEPFYEKIADFGVEFVVHKDVVTFVGISVFEATNGNYQGNLLISEAQKEAIIAQWIPIAILHKVIQRLSNILKRDIAPWYTGCLGVDMMIVDNGKQTCLHPCVEINLRRTMGHVAISLYPYCKGNYESMRIDFHDGKYQLFLNTKTHPNQ